MRVKLDDYQIKAVNQLKNGSILCGGVGSGKSRTGIAYYFLKVCNNMKNPKELYIITTPKKRDTKEWEAELAPFLLSTDLASSTYKVKIVVDSWNNIKKYEDVVNAFFIFDEQRVVGYGTWSKTFIKISKGNEWILLTATPGDTWSDYIPVFIANGFYKNKTAFVEEHVVYNYRLKFPQIDHYIGQGKLVKQRNSILVNMDYIRPTVHHNERVIVDYDAARFKRVRKDRWNDEKNLPIENVSELCYLLRKISNTHPSRLEAVIELVKLHPKVIIFYNFDYELEALRTLQYPKGTKIAEWNGHKHEPIPTNSKWVYLVQYTAGAEGWNCTQTDTIIFYSQNYSYKIVTQAKGRIDRRNTPYSELYYYHIRSNSPIDIGISRALNQKKNFEERGFASI